MSTVPGPTQPFDQAAVLDFARAFRAAARAVGFYPPAHPAVVSSLQEVMQATGRVAGNRSLALTVLPNTLLAHGTPIDSSESTVAEVAGILHRHGVGALNISNRATVESWRALFELLANKPENVRRSGGIQRQWTVLRHPSPAILEIDFGELLRGRVGGDFAELAGVINYYLEMGGGEASPAEDVLAALVKAIESAPDDQEAVSAILRELRAAAYLTRVMQPERLDDMFGQAAKVGDRLNLGVMAGLIEKRGTTDAMVGPLDIVTSFFDRMVDGTVSSFLHRAVTGSDVSPQQLTDVFVAMVPDPARRRRLLEAAPRAGTMEAGTLARWEQFENQLEAWSDRQYVSDQYAHELHSARSRSGDHQRQLQDPPERVAAWVQSIEDVPVRELDTQMLSDLVRVETDPVRWSEFLPVLEQQVIDAAEQDDWRGAATIVGAIAREAGTSYDEMRRQHGHEVLKKLAASPTCQEGMTRLIEGRDPSGHVARLLQAIGPVLVPVLLRRWAGASDSAARGCLERIVADYGKDGREPLRRQLNAEEPELRIAAMRMLEQSRSTDHLPSLEAMLIDAHLGVQREALRALATAESDRAQDILARGVARADQSMQIVLLEDVLALGPERASRVLRRMLARLDQRTTEPSLYLSVIAALRRVGNADAVSALALVFEHTRWRAPLRAMRFRAAARAALRGIGGTAASDLLRRTAVLRGIGGAVRSRGAAADVPTSPGPVTEE